MFKEGSKLLWDERRIGNDSVKLSTAFTEIEKELWNKVKQELNKQYADSENVHRYIEKIEKEIKNGEILIKKRNLTAAANTFNHILGELDKARNFIKNTLIKDEKLIEKHEKEVLKVDAKTIKHINSLKTNVNKLMKDII